MGGIDAEKVMNLKSSQRFLVPFGLKTPFVGILFRQNKVFLFKILLSSREFHRLSAGFRDGPMTEAANWHGSCFYVYDSRANRRITPLLRMNGARLKREHHDQV
ncbi:hypothetical protein GVN24_18030 [Rhizobium sp. CRIBSB]|nr:hypothetical protein [Rhizobium sp. CRIBSB]